MGSGLILRSVFDQIKIPGLRSWSVALKILQGAYSQFKKPLQQIFTNSWLIDKMFKKSTSTCVIFQIILCLREWV
jgi:hypothetical protein